MELNNTTTTRLKPPGSPSKVLQSLLDGELSIQSELLGHVAHPGTRDSRLPGARGSSKHQDAASIYQSLAHDALQ